MMRSGNAVPSHSGLIPFETLYEKRGGLLWPIARKRNLRSLHTAALFTIFLMLFGSRLQISRLFKNRSINFCKSLKISRLIIDVRLLQVSRTLKTGKVIKRDFKFQKLSNRFCVYKWRPLIIHWHCIQVSYARAQQAPLEGF